MSFDYKSELKKIVSSKQLVQVHFSDTPSEFRVAFILAINNEFITLAEVNDSATFDGVCMYRMEDIVCIKVESLYITELVKRIESDFILKTALKDVENVKKFTFDGFISGLKGSKTIVEVAYDKDEGRAGRIVDSDDVVLVFDEYRAEANSRVARAYINLGSIIRISIDIPWLRTITRLLSDKNL